MHWLYRLFIYFIKVSREKQAESQHGAAKLHLT